MNAYNLNTLLRLNASFTLADGVTLADPTVATLTLTDPRGAVTTPALTHDSLGTYHVDITPTVSGVWTYLVAGTGAVIATNQSQFFVEPAIP